MPVALITCPRFGREALGGTDPAIVRWVRASSRRYSGSAGTVWCWRGRSRGPFRSGSRLPRSRPGRGELFRTADGSPPGHPVRGPIPSARRAASWLGPMRSGRPRPPDVNDFSARNTSPSDRSRRASATVTSSESGAPAWKGSRGLLPSDSFSTRGESPRFGPFGLPWMSPSRRNPSAVSSASDRLPPTGTLAEVGVERFDQLSTRCGGAGEVCQRFVERECRLTPGLRAPPLRDGGVATRAAGAPYRVRLDARHGCSDRLPERPRSRCWSRITTHEFSASLGPGRGTGVDGIACQVRAQVVEQTVDRPVSPAGVGVHALRMMASRSPPRRRL